MSWCCMKMKKRGSHGAQKNNILVFDPTQIKAMTQDFPDENPIEENEFASVYRGSLPSGKTVAVKILKPGAVQEESQFIDQIQNMGCVDHPNLISLLGYCSDKAFQTLVFEFEQNKNLTHHLHEGESVLSWDIRVKIAIGVAQALCYLHSQGITHCDVKPANIFLNKDFEAQVADFGCTKQSLPCHYNRIIDTSEYVAPEYGWGKCTDRSDVYSFGLILIEILTGRVIDEKITDEYESIAAWAKARIAIALEDGDFSGVVDSRLMGVYNEGDMYNMVKAIVECINYKPKARPTMKEVLAILEGEADMNYKLVRSDSSIQGDKGYALSMKIMLENKKRYIWGGKKGGNI